MPRTKPSTRVGPGGMKRRLQLATRDSRLPLVVAPKVVTAANVARNEACVPGCTAVAVVLCDITNPIDSDVLEGALGQAFASLDSTDWEASMTLFCPLGFQVILQSGLLEAIAEVSLRFARQAKLSTYEGLQSGPNLRRVFKTVLD